MRAHVGDRLNLHGKVVGQTSEHCEVLEVLGEDGGPPYRVRHADGHEGILVPGADAVVEPKPAG
ncbi:MAG: DUF1918 domain-containing protein [Actinomycetes bacterium]